MSDKEEKFKILKVTMERHFYIPMIDNERTEINGWTIEEVIEDWFKTHGSNSHHATRDGHEIGNSNNFIKAEVVVKI